jgi:Holliday junction resolvasome RuvABC endonuclease subunit
MRTVGIDIASKSYSALAVVEEGAPQSAVVWKPKNAKDSEPELLDQFYKWLVFKLGMLRPDIIAVEQQAGFVKNHNVIRSLSKREGVALLAAKQRKGAIVVNPVVSQARGVVFGKGNMSKDDAWGAIKKMYPQFPFLPKTSGGTDQADAVVHALAAPVILERR